MGDARARHAPDAEVPADLHTRLVDSPAGRVGVTLLVAVLAVWLVGPNVPDGPARQTLDVVWQPGVTVGLEQNWSVFSPDPRAESLEVVAIVEHGDGSTEEWRIPEADPVVGPYRSYRWRKWQELVRLDVNERFWDPTAEWVAREHARDGRLPSTVRLIRRWKPIAPLTADGIAPTSWNEFEFHVWTSP